MMTKDQIFTQLRRMLHEYEQQPDWMFEGMYPQLRVAVVGVAIPVVRLKQWDDPDLGGMTGHLQVTSPSYMTMEPVQEIPCDKCGGSGFYGHGLCLTRLRRQMKRNIEMTNEPITGREMWTLFGDEMPIEAVKLVFNAPPDALMSEVRKQLIQLAKEYNAGLLLYDYDDHAGEVCT